MKRALTKLLEGLGTIVLFALAIAMTAQTKPSTVGKPIIEKPEETVGTVTVDFSAGKPLATLPVAEALMSPVRCTQSGTTFFDIFADTTSPAVAGFPQLYSIDHLGEVKHLRRNLPPNYKDFTVLDSFPSSHALFSVVQANGNGSMCFTQPERP